MSNPFPAGHPYSLHRPGKVALILPGGASQRWVNTFCTLDSYPHMTDVYCPPSVGGAGGVRKMWVCDITTEDGTKEWGGFRLCAPCSKLLLWPDDKQRAEFSVDADADAFEARLRRIWKEHGSVGKPPSGPHRVGAAFFTPDHVNCRCYVGNIDWDLINKWKS